MTTPWWIHLALAVLPVLSGFISSSCYMRGPKSWSRLITWALFSMSLCLLGILLANAATGTPSLSPLP